MVETITIAPEERKKLTTGDAKKAPKYTFYALSNSVKYSSANQQATVGSVQEIYEEFEEAFPEGDFDDWRDFYYNQHGGRERLREATDKAYDMFLTIRAAIDSVNREDVRNFVEGLVLNGTYSNQNAHEAVTAKIMESRSEFEYLRSNEGPDECDLRLGSRYVSIQPESMRSEDLFDDEEIIVFYFEEHQSDSGITIDMSASNASLDEFTQ